MAEITYRGNLSASQFPFVSTYAGRTAIVVGPDQNYVRGLQVPVEGLVDENDKGIPQIIYCHNVMPSAQGFQSIRLIQKVAPLGGNPLIDNVYINVKVSLNLEQRGYLVFSRDLGTMYILFQTPSTGVWTWLSIVISPPNDIPNIVSVTSAMVNGVTYYLLNPNDLYTITDPCRIYNDGLNLFETVTLIGTANAFAGAKIRGNASAFGYHILWNESVLAWSSLLDPLDFTPSLISGAGFESIQDARGSMVAVVKHQLGLIIYTTGNCVSATYTGNPLRPFIFREITGVGGFPNWSPIGPSPQDLISNDSNTQNQYAYTSSGLQKIGMSNINVVNTDLTDFISGKIFEDFNTTSRTFTQTILPSTQSMNKKITTVSDRYLVISYGLEGLTHALIYDLVTKRWGKIKTNHTAVFTLAPTLQGAQGDERGQIAFLTKDGEVSIIGFDTVGVAHEGVLIIGKFQYSRARNLQLEHVALESPYQFGDTRCYDMYSYDGKNTAGDALGYPEITAPNLRSWAFHQNALNHTLYFYGGFYATTFVMKFVATGKR